MKLRWLGHASWKIKTKKGTVIYIDPYAGEYDEKADIILVSHHHHDHAGAEQIRQARADETKVFTTRIYAAQIDATPMETGQTVEVKDVSIQAVPAYNVRRFRNPGEPYHPKDEALGFLLLIEDKVVYFSGDTDMIPEMEELGQVDLALLPVGGTYTMDAKEAAQAAEKIGPRRAIPMHYGKIVGNIEDAEYFQELAEKEGVKVRIMKEGEELEF
ncbi:MBL fold metallo-hydrolase [Candidatus Woesearchaeota archaeon]|nr:MBL fold metallo-hydrolase [Candidatus Woesearchaeota archaeon]